MVQLSMGVRTQPVASGKLQWHPYVGVAYARLNNELDIGYSGRDVATASEQQTSRFSGFGPLFGMNMAYVLNHGFSLISGLNYNALIGNIKSHYQASATPSGGSAETSVSIEDRTKHSIVSLIRLDLGLHYDLQLRSMPVGVTLGYQVAKYFGGSQQMAFADDIQYQFVNTSIQGSGFQGPFLQLNTHFSV